jgi:hypothetical protein
VRDPPTLWYFDNTLEQNSLDSLGEKLAPPYLVQRPDQFPASHIHVEIIGAKHLDELSVGDRAIRAFATVQLGSQVFASMVAGCLDSHHNTRLMKIPHNPNPVWQERTRMRVPDDTKSMIVVQIHQWSVIVSGTLVLLPSNIRLTYVLSFYVLLNSRPLVATIN